MRNAEIEDAIDAFRVAVMALDDFKVGHRFIGTDSTAQIVMQARIKVAQAEAELWAAIARALEK